MRCYSISVKIYTKTGDDGTTGIIGGARVQKHDARIEAIGTVDELNAHIGVLIEDLKAQTPHITQRETLLQQIQNDLFTLGSELADPAGKYVTTLLTDDSVAALEHAIDEREATLPPLKNFILPAGTPWAAKAHLARAVCRRAERCITRLNTIDTTNGATIGTATPLRPTILKYLNRLSDLLFVLAREDVALNNGEEIIWQPYVRH